MLSLENYEGRSEASINLRVVLSSTSASSAHQIVFIVDLFSTRVKAGYHALEEWKRFAK